MERVEGTLYFFVDKAPVRHGYARTDQGKQVFVPAMSLRKLVDGKMRHCAFEERPAVITPAKIVMYVSPDGKGLIANNWAIIGAAA